MIVFHGISIYFTVFHRISCSTKTIQPIHGREFPEDPLELAVLKLKNKFHRFQMILWSFLKNMVPDSWSKCPVFCWFHLSFLKFVGNVVGSFNMFYYFPTLFISLVSVPAWLNR